ncbi:hypothetical protein [Thalassobius sp. Cn5-15]|uniref:hypothetical protein n=1 Tax=Thalassobius sp. Cn5-15 TaxID=2917763 RepID=UPI001EF290A4|nr:hypothetical protein [Thalassobius sp. Cn5-15]MCG7492346.1 hypothetical protein [Thalassobius sp. Cn5-15]
MTRTAHHTAPPHDAKAEDPETVTEVSGVSVDLVVSVVEDTLGETVTKVTCPGGRDRAIFRVYTDTQSVIASRRDYANGAKREARILEHLAPLTDHFPQILANRDDILVQTDMGDVTLAQDMRKTDTAGRIDLMDRAISSVFGYQMDIGHPFPQAEVPVLFEHRKELGYFVDGPWRTAGVFGVRLPNYDRNAVAAHFLPSNACFLKWDNRFANAALSPKGAVGWFDFEDSCLGAGYEDLAWLAADEFPALSFDKIYPLFDRQIRDYHGIAGDMILRRFHIMTTLLISLRTRRIGRHLSKKGKWYTLDEIYRSDRVGAHPSMMQALLKRGKAFAALERETKPLVVMFEDIEARLAGAKSH